MSDLAVLKFSQVSRRGMSQVASLEEVVARQLSRASPFGVIPVESPRLVAAFLGLGRMSYPDIIHCIGKLLGKYSHGGSCSSLMM
jgi:hypothetical protein